MSSGVTLTGTSRLTSIICVLSLTSSLPRRRREAFVHRTFLGLRFFLNNLWHFDRQNLKTVLSFLTKVTPCPGIINQLIKR